MCFFFLCTVCIQFTNLCIYMCVCVEMAEVSKVLYIVVASDDEDDNNNSRDQHSLLSSSSFRYTRPVLQSTFQLMGCKARHAFKVYYLFISFILFVSRTNRKWLMRLWDFLDLIYLYFCFLLTAFKSNSMGTIRMFGGVWQYMRFVVFYLQLRFLGGFGVVYNPNIWSLE